MKLSLEAIMQRLMARGTQVAQTAPVPDERTPTTIRLKPATKHFLQCQATALNTSVQGLVDAILDGVAEATLDTPATKLRSIRERFFLLIQAHRLDLPAAVELLADEGFTLSALGNDDRLMDLMTPKAINRLSEMFYVNPKWLNAKYDNVIETGSNVRWYKNVHSIARRLIDLRQQGLQPDLMLIRRRGADFDRAYDDNDNGKWRAEPIGIVMRVVKSTPSGADFTTYQVWDFERWNAEPCRQDLKLLIAFCEQLRVYTVGHELREEALDNLVAGSQLPAEILFGLGSITWHPDDYVGFAYEARHEKDEWPSVAERYLKSGLPELAMQAGAAALPEHPWRPTAAATSS